MVIDPSLGKVLQGLPTAHALQAGAQPYPDRAENVDVPSSDLVGDRLHRRGADDHGCTARTPQ